MKPLILAIVAYALLLPAEALAERFLAFGDSNTFGHGDTGVACSQTGPGGYPPRLRSLLQDSGLEIEILNFGVCGETTAQGVSRIENVLDANGEVIVIMEATNDVSQAVSAETILFNLDRMADKAESVGVDPLMASVVPRGPGASRDASNSKTGFIAEQLKADSAAANRVFADPFHALFDRDDFFDRFYFNDLHPNASGFDIVAEAMFAPAIEAIERRGSITGRVTEATTGQPIAFLRIDAVHSGGAQDGGSDVTDADGRFAIGDLAAGTYFVSTFSQFLFRDELYDDIPCPPDDCDVTMGTPVAVSFGATTPGIDFELTPLECCQSGPGTLSDSGALIVPGFEVDLSDPDGPGTLFAVRNTTDSPRTIEVNFYPFDVRDAPLRTDTIDLGPQENAPVNVGTNVSGLLVENNMATGLILINQAGGGADDLQGDYFRVDFTSDFATGDRMVRPSELCVLQEIRYVDFGGGTRLRLLLDDPPFDGSAALAYTAYADDGSIVDQGDFISSNNLLVIDQEELVPGQGFGTLVLDFGPSGSGWASAEYSAFGRFSLELNSACLQQAPPAAALSSEVDPDVETRRPRPGRQRIPD